MKRIRLVAVLGLLTMVLAACGGSSGGASKTKIVFFSQQQVQTVAFEMAQEKGYFAAENLDVELKYFASGTTALQTFKAGEGHIVYSGDVPAIRYWADSEKAYQIIAPAERNSKGYQLVTKAEITSPADLKGKTLGARVGSSGSHFLWAYFNKHGLTDVKVTNMDGQVAISALDRGDIDGFFYWAPFPTRAQEISGNKVHVLADASEVVAGYYTLLGGNPAWIKENAKAVEGFLRAARKGQEYAVANKEEVKQYLKTKFDLDPAASEVLWQNEEFLLKMDTAFFNDMKGLGEWLNAEALMTEKLDFNSFLYTAALKAVDPKLVEQGK